MFTGNAPSSSMRPSFDKTTSLTLFAKSVVLQRDEDHGGEAII